MKCLVCHEVAGGRRGVKDVEEVATERGRRDDEEERSAVSVKRLAVGEAAVTERDEFVSKRGLVSRREVAEEAFGKGVGGISLEGGVDGFEAGIGKIASGPGCRWRKGGAEDAREDVLGVNAGGVEKVAEGSVSDGGSDSLSGAEGESGAEDGC